MSKHAVALAQFVEQVVSQFVAWFGGSIPSYSMSKCPQVQDAETEVAPSLECVHVNVRGSWVMEACSKTCFECSVTEKYSYVSTSPSFTVIM